MKIYFYTGQNNWMTFILPFSLSHSLSLYLSLSHSHCLSISLSYSLILSLSHTHFLSLFHSRSLSLSRSFPPSLSLFLSLTLSLSLPPSLSQSGRCFRMITERTYELLAPHSIPEMLRAPLESLILQVGFCKSIFYTLIS